MKKKICIVLLATAFIFSDADIALLTYCSYPLVSSFLALLSLFFAIYSYLNPIKSVEDADRDAKINQIYAYVKTNNVLSYSVVRSLINIQISKKIDNSANFASNVFKYAKVILSASKIVKNFAKLQKSWENDDGIIYSLLSEGEIFLAEQKLIQTIKEALENEPVGDSQICFCKSVAERLFVVSKISQCYGTIEGYRNAARYSLKAFEVIADVEIMLKKKYFSSYIFSLIDLYKTFGEVIAIDIAIKKTTEFSKRLDIYNDSYLWAICKMLCGVSLCVKGEMTGNVSLFKAATSMFDEASKFIGKDVFPEDWGAIQNNRGLALLLWGIQAIDCEYLICAARSFEEAVSVEMHTSLDEKEGVHVNLGNAYMEISKLNKKQGYLKKALAAFKVALDITNLEDSPESYFAARIGISETLRYIGEEKGDERWINNSIKYLHSELKKNEYKIFPVHYAMLQNNLSIALQAKGRFNNDMQFYKNAYSLSHSAVTEISRYKFPMMAAMFYNSEGNAALLVGKNTPDLEYIALAIKAFELGLKEISSRENPNLWGTLNFGLSDAYRLLADMGLGSENYTKSIECMIENFHIYKQDVDPFCWAKVCNDIAVSYRHLFSATSEHQHLISSILFFKKSLSVYSPETTPIDWQMSKKNLAEALLVLGGCGHIDSTEFAIVEYKELLRNAKHGCKRNELYGIRHNLGYALYIWGSQTKNYYVLCEAEKNQIELLNDLCDDDANQRSLTMSIIKDIQCELRNFVPDK